MGCGLIKVKVSEMEKLDKIVRNGRTFKASTLARVEERINDWKEPVTNKRFIAFA